MTEFTIHNFRYFLEELEKDLRIMAVSLDEESNALERIYILHAVMSKICENWSNKLEHQK